jgi:hypothetical protein
MLHILHATCVASNGSSKYNLAAPKKRITSTPNMNENRNPLHDGVRKERERESWNGCLRL